jgi:hypothetical protein
MDDRTIFTPEQVSALRNILHYAAETPGVMEIKLFTPTELWRICVVVNNLPTHLRELQVTQQLMALLSTDRDPDHGRIFNALKALDLVDIGELTAPVRGGHRPNQYAANAHFA